jgi:hypothetical protein
MANPNPSPATRFSADNPGRAKRKGARDRLSAAFLTALADELHCRTLATVATLERRFKYDARPDDKRRAHAGSDRADSGVGTAVAPVGETTRLPRFGFRAGFRNNLRLHKDITFIKLPPNCRRSPSEYLLRGSSTYLARARFRLKIALRSGGLARRVGRVDCNALRLGWGGTANPYRSSQQPNTSATRRLSSALRPQAHEDLWPNPPGLAFWPIRLPCRMGLLLGGSIANGTAPFFAAFSRVHCRLSVRLFITRGGPFCVNRW